MTTHMTGLRALAVTVLTVAAAPVWAQDGDWAGAYGGLSFGFAATDGRAERTNGTGPLIELDISNGLFPDDITKSDTDPVAGVTLGYNLQRGSLVGGIELDLSATDHGTTATFSRIDPGPLFPGVVTDTRYRTDISRMATLRLRGGFAADRTLFYGTAGLAAGRVANTFTLELPNFPGLPDGYASPDWRQDDTRYGYVVGAGLERRLSERVSLKGEVLYFDLEDATVEGRDPASFPGQEIDYTFDNTGVVFNIGLNVSF